MKSTNKEQWNLLLGSLFIQAIIFLLLSFFDDSVEIVACLAVPLIMLFFYLPAWLILKIDLLSKILLSKFISWTTGIFWFLLMVVFYNEKGFLSGTLWSIWLALALFTIFAIADEEIRPKIGSLGGKGKKSPPEPELKIKNSASMEEADDFFVECTNCGTKHKNPIDSLCSNCGKDMYKKDNNIKCKSCGSEYDPLQPNCPICGN
ncbi:MAG: hypothetical protein HQL46_13140 [Gammaproteobacteria bacterium]|nr:hypothetical protein [Gammaproteobacteria bacterium]